MGRSVSDNRYAYWDNVKFLLILLVVLGHMVDRFTEWSEYARGLFLFIYIFHMPLFIFTAGVFHRDSDIKKKCAFYVALGFLSKILFYLVYRLVGQPAEFTLFSEKDIPWFAFAMAAFILLAYLVRNLDKRLIILINIAIACFTGYVSSIGDFLVLSRIIVFFPFYLAGTMVRPEKIPEIKKRHRGALAAAAVVIIAALAFMCFFRCGFFYRYRHLLVGRNPFLDYIRSYAPIARLCCFAAAILAGAAVLVLVPERRIGPFTRMGSNTLQVFIWHWPVFLLLERIFNIVNLCRGMRGGIVVFLLAGVVLTMVLSVDKVLGWPLRLLRRAILGSG